MDLPRPVSALAVVLAASACVFAQTSNPFAGDVGGAEAGRAVFRAHCSSCHGADGEGGRAPNLIGGNFHNGDRDPDIYRTISAGLPATEMPGWSGKIESDDIWRVIAFLRSAHRESRPVAGDGKNGESLFWGKGTCGDCHAIGGRGNLIGPDLSRTGWQRGAAYLREAIAHPEFPLLRDYHGVTVVTRSGQKITGIEKARDDFSVVLIDFKGKVYSFDRSMVTSVTPEVRSLMPAYSGLFSEAEMNDVIAYLGTLNGAGK